MKKNIAKSLFASVLSMLMLGGCANQGLVQEDDPYNRTKTGAIGGAIGGAVIGATTGHGSTDRRQRALVGAALGGLLGAGIGYSLDQQANEIARALGTGVDNDPLAALDPERDIIVSKTSTYVKIMFRDDMMFAVNSTRLQPTARTKVGKIGQLLLNYPQTIVQIAGHTDNDGSYTYNQSLSENRANSVANTLTGSGIQNVVATAGCSYSNELAPNTSKRNKALNRRVEIYLYGNQNHMINPCQ
ncbi:MAG: OmpA family protein [Campylobacterales bacterium]|nr:OmpA family protein [Campylobacterales bacterium]